MPYEHLLVIVVVIIIIIALRKLLDNVRRKVNQLNKVIGNRNVNLSACRFFVVCDRPSIEYGS